MHLLKFLSLKYVFELKKCLKYVCVYSLYQTLTQKEKSSQIFCKNFKVCHLDPTLVFSNFDT